MFEHKVFNSKLLEINTSFTIRNLAEAESRISLSAETQTNQQRPSFVTILTAWKKLSVDLLLAIR